MKQVELRYVAHITALTGRAVEHYTTAAASIRDLVEELDSRYPHFRQVFVDPATGSLALNAMIYYADPGQVPVSVIDLGHPLADGGTVTFW